MLLMPWRHFLPINLHLHLQQMRQRIESKAGCRTTCNRSAQWLRIFTRRRAIDWLCSWHTRDSVTPSTAAISFRFMSCS